jgi:hypothetical protein
MGAMLSPVGWKRWLKYGKARVDAAVRDVEDVLDRKEDELRRDQGAKPWLGSDDDVPSYDDATARIEDRLRAAGIPAQSSPPSPPADDETVAKIRAFDVAEQQRKADDRLASIRDSLGIKEKE